MRNRLIFALLWGASSFANAALSPYDQSVKEITAILQHQDVIQKIGTGTAVDGVGRTDAEGGYVIDAKGCYLIVKLVFEPARPGIVGPRNFRIQVPGELVCDEGGGDGGGDGGERH